MTPISRLEARPGRLPGFRRAVGVLLILVGPEVGFWGHGGPGPFHVPAWSVGGRPIDLPLPPLAIDVAAWSAYVAAALALLCGARGPAAPAVGAAVLAYYGSRDLWACNSSYVVVIFTYLVALLFEREPRSWARRLVQVSVSACYVVSAVHKAIQPDWIRGETLAEMARHGTGLRPLWGPILGAVGPGDAAFRILAGLVVAGEAYIGIGLWPRRTRRAALIAGILLHASILLLIDGVDLFTPVMLAGYLAFPVARPGGEDGPETSPSPTWQASLAAAFAATMILMPVRIYAGPLQDARALTFFDRSPWSFSMFLFLQEVDEVEAAVLGPDGGWRSVVPPGRGVRGASDAELSALARHLLGETPGARAARVRCRITINHRRRLAKEVVLSRPASASGPGSGASTRAARSRRGGRGVVRLDRSEAGVQG